MTRREASTMGPRVIVVVCVLALFTVACGSAGHPTGTTRRAANVTTPTTPTTSSTATTTTSSSTTTSLPGTGKPAVVIGDKNYNEQFVLGELYYYALTADGFDVSLTRNIGATSVTVQALATGRLAMYPEYLQTWNTQVAGDLHIYRSPSLAYQAAQRYALKHGFVLLNPTPFSDTWGIAVTDGYAALNGLGTIGDLQNVGQPLTLGGPAPLAQGPQALLPAIEHRYGVTPTSFVPLAVGDQYPALDSGAIKAALVMTTDGQLAFGDYQLLADPRNVFGWGQVVPVLSAKALSEEGPAFEETINRVSALLTTPVMRQLNALVDVAGEDPAAVAKQFLETHGVIPASSS